ncbi:uncharacterized protein CMU_013990 [Cryptosporidium muris RN66]|uniref:Uncharacterized protein n=1 Tax=Cryptosporidium muris (strain RN66) TaxID=441375 RepID=B6AEV7_CRYMR|nr:uncharacterized protein CMU_013990 [Cryptosporidium muris RN66]EEA06724.1 hypothetical protein, conserved [Cryptosporidium muris RN66]|eukprot:XP_002141073.1 hypothetical protein [Cryptosporidium muris RN66]
MRKVQHFFNIQRFIGTIESRSIECIVNVAERMLNYVEKLTKIPNEVSKKMNQTLDCRLVQELVYKIQEYKRWLEVSGVMEIPEEYIAEYRHLASLGMASEQTQEVDSKNTILGVELSDITNKELFNKSQIVHENCENLVIDILSILEQCYMLQNQLDKLQETLRLKEKELSDRCQSKKIVDIFLPVIQQLRQQHEDISQNEGTIDQLQEMIRNFCTLLEERNELRYRLVYGVDKTSENLIIEEPKKEKIIESSLNKPDSENVDNSNTELDMGLYGRFSSVAIDPNAMKLFARWSLPIDSVTGTIIKR